MRAWTKSTLLLLAGLLAACATPHFTGSDTVRCSSRGRYTETVDRKTHDTTRVMDCVGEMVMTGHLSDQGAAVALKVLDGATQAARAAAVP